MLFKMGHLFLFCSLILSSTLLQAEHYHPDKKRPLKPSNHSKLEEDFSDEYYQLKGLILQGQQVNEVFETDEYIIHLIETISPKEKDRLFEMVMLKISQNGTNIFYQETLLFIRAAFNQVQHGFSLPLDSLRQQKKAIQEKLHTAPLESPDTLELVASLKLIECLIKRSPVPLYPLRSAQDFPKLKTPDWGEPFPVFQHPSGALQLGRAEFTYPRDGKNYPRIPISPGISFGTNVLRISLHGDGREDDYALTNPNSNEIPVGHLAYLRKTGTSSRELLPFRKNLTANSNPSEIISESCNFDRNGCTPATYARWLQVERYPEDSSPLQLRKVVMTPRGFFSAGGIDGLGGRIYGEQGSFGHPYWFLEKAAAPREYRLVRGGNPENESAWVDTGIYSDSRQASFPLISIYGEAQEFGRHLGLSKELGGGNTLSYLDKISLLNQNPDATYFQKVRSNWARPIGSAATLIKDSFGLSWDLYRNLFY